MDSPNLLKGLFNKLNNDSNFVGGEGGGRTQLTPYLSLVVSILYMMVADGEISDQESSQLQSVVGKNDNVLKRALNYVETTKIEQFLKDVPSVLDSQDSLCILMNVCDSIMADGQLAELEIHLFQRLMGALGHSKKSFRSYYKTVSIKNKKSVLGSFENFTDSDQLTPQLTLAASVLYMMSADGSMAEEEIGQLNVVIGRSDSLLKAGLKYVRTVKFQQFVKDAAAILNPAQQLCILINVCDSMMSDGEIANAEMELFKRLLMAFDSSEEKFQPYFNILLRKNKKPEEKDDENSYSPPIPARIKKEEEEKFLFDRKISVNDDKLEAPGEIASAAAEDHQPGDPTERSELGIIINRKMQDNINRMSESIQGENGIEEITGNANSIQGNEEHALRDYKDEKSYADTAVVEDSVHYLDHEKSKDSVHYLDKEGSKKSVHYLDDAAINPKAATLQPLSGHRKQSGPAKQRAIKDSHRLMPGKALVRRGTSPSELRVISDNQVEIDASPVEVRMTVVQTRTIEINQTLDQLETVSDAQFFKRGLILSTISFSPAPLPAYPDSDKVSSHSLLVNSPISILQNEAFHVAANNSALENSASTVGLDGWKVKIASLFSALIIAHGFCSFGESTAQKDFIQNGILASNAHVSLQAVATQQTLYQLAADELDSSLSRKEFFSNEQLEKEKSKLAAYLARIEHQESAPASGDGKKELSAARKHQEELAATDSKMLEWFVLSKAILLFGIGLTLCGFFFKSRFTFYGASLAAVVGTLLMLNGYYLFI